jgi:ATP-binding cassette subfamily B protein
VNTIRFLLPHARIHWRRYLLGLLLAPVTTVAALSIPYLTGRAVEVLETLPPEVESGPSAGGPWAALFPILGLILGMSFVRGASLFAVRFLVITASRKVEFDLRNRLFAHLQRLDQLFVKSSRTGDLMARFTSDVERVRAVAGPVVMYTTTTTLLLAVALPLMASVSWLLTVCIMVPLSLLTLAVRKIGPRVHGAMLRSQETLSELTSLGQENFAGVRVVKSFAQEESEGRRFRDVARDYLEHNLVAARISNWMIPLIGGVSDLSLMSLLLVGGLLALATKLDLSDIVEFSGYQALLLWPMISLGWVVNQFQRASASVERLQEFLAATPQVRPPAEPRLPSAGCIEGHISIRNLSFSFGDHEVLRDVSLEIPRGSTAAVVGRTGSGKSTLVSLIPRIYPVPPETIFIDGIDVNALPLEALRRSTGFVPQESFLFSRTVNENIAFGTEGPDLEDVYGVAQITRIDQDIDQFPRGYHELVGERGVTLSGGQKQRTAIARALIVRPKILILDDALSAVDTHTEEEILENLRRVTKHMTTIVISHRISSIKHADRIYVLEGGLVAEEGSHEQLLKQEGLYADMYRRQLLSDELDQM